MDFPSTQPFNCVYIKKEIINNFLFIFPAGGMKIISRLVQIHKMDRRSKLEEEREREQQVPSSPTILPASPVPDALDKTTGMQFGGGANSDSESGEGSVPRQRRKSSSNRLQRQEKSVREGKGRVSFK